MKVVLLQRVRSRDPIFYAEGPALVVAEIAVARGQARTKLERIARGAKTAIWRGGRRAGPLGRRVLGWLKQKPGPEEALLRSLRTAKSIELFHPSSLDTETVRHMWMHFLGRGQKHHLLAALGHLALAGVTTPLMFLPGPNVVSYWFLFRATIHALALLGSRRAQGGRFQTTLVPVPALDEALPETGMDPTLIDRVSAACGVEKLRVFLRRMESCNPSRKPERTHE